MGLLVSLRLGQRHTIELGLHLLFPLTMAAVTWLLARAFFPGCFPNWAPAMYWLVAGVVVIVDALAGLMHELGHALVAIARGRRVYRITLYGLAAAVRRSDAPTRPRDQFAIAMAGPLSHLLLGSALFSVWGVLPMSDSPLHMAIGFSAASTFAAGVLNLIPVAPLDGARLARALAAVASVQAASPLVGAISWRKRSES